ncbi:hypothetical protein HYALB_00007702 [Hymenoscyphus albidus]|uniref:Uncharacterized protein n=1 Tax=Hymenoscyphus albidus TaxID=595503 RepID=A0A9N9LJ17_9HELO|nr:hypothetical protein HYALB_00007702 [Hymenoscyphus albidus]
MNKTSKPTIVPLKPPGFSKSGSTPAGGVNAGPSRRRCIASGDEEFADVMDRSPCCSSKEQMNGLPVLIQRAKFVIFRDDPYCVTLPAQSSHQHNGYTAN